MTATSASGIDRESRKSPDQFSVEMVRNPFVRSRMLCSMILTNLFFCMFLLSVYSSLMSCVVVLFFNDCRDPHDWRQFDFLTAPHLRQSIAGPLSAGYTTIQNRNSDLYYISYSRHDQMYPPTFRLLRVAGLASNKNDLLMPQTNYATYERKHQRKKLYLR